MHLHCHLGRIAPIEEDPSANLKGAQNARKWVFDLTLPLNEISSFSIQLVAWRTGREAKDGHGRPVLRGKLMPHAIPLNRAAARSTIYFPAAEDGKLMVVVEPGLPPKGKPEPEPAPPPPEKPEEEAGEEAEEKPPAVEKPPEIRLRLVVDAPSTLAS
ncbi:MAG: hypothetical protein ACE5F6_00260 [Anaerolineae bacterium]